MPEPHRVGTGNLFNSWKYEAQKSSRNERRQRLPLITRLQPLNQVAQLAIEFPLGNCLAVELGTAQFGSSQSGLASQPSATCRARPDHPAAVFARSGTNNSYFSLLILRLPAAPTVHLIQPVFFFLLPTRPPFLFFFLSTSFTSYVSSHPKLRHTRFTLFPFNTKSFL